jgi:hypothetical protein
VVVTIDHDGLSEFGLPISPKISRIRTDLSWKDVMYDYSQRNTKSMRSGNHKMRRNGGEGDIARNLIYLNSAISITE